MNFGAYRGPPPAIDDVGHVDGLSGQFYVRGVKRDEDPFDAVIGQFQRSLQQQTGAALDRRILPPEEWIENPYYSGPFALDFLWPAKKQAFIEAANGKQVEVIFTGALGTGKTALLVLIALYDAYRLSCLTSPQAYLGFPITSRLVSVFISLNLEKAKEKLFDPFKQAVDTTPYFQRECPRDKNLESKVRFPSKNVEFRPGVTSEAAIHGEDVRGLYATEVSFYAIIEQSRKKRGGETLDVAADIVTQAYRRMESRFMRDGRLQFCRVVLDSSRQYPDDFIAQREKLILAGENPYPGLVFSWSQWDAKRGAVDTSGHPFYSGEEFPVEVGTGSRASRILDPEEVEHAVGKIVWCAVEHRAAFEHDVDGSLRDLAGVPVEGLRPLIPQKEMLVECLRVEDAGFLPHQCRHPFSSVTTTLRDAVSFIQEVLIDPRERLPWVNPDKIRVVHADPGITGDAFGLSVGHVESMVTVNRLTNGLLELPCMICADSKTPGTLDCPRCRGEQYMVHFGRKVKCHGCQGLGRAVCPGCRGTAKHGTPLERPRIYMDLMLRITPPKSGRIQFDDVEALLARLRAGGFMIGVVTADGHQSEQFLQRQAVLQGVFVAEKLSVDVTKDPYYALRDAIMDRASDGRRRFSMYDYEPAFEEIRRVEDRRDKVDHAHGYQKDTSDSVAGVVFNCERYEFLRYPVLPGDLDIARF
jgi:hypothetical protein